MWGKNLSARKLIKLQLNVQKLMLAFIFSKVVRLESLPG